MAPGSTSHHIFSLTILLRCTFRLQISLCNQSWRDWLPLYSVGCKLFSVCAGTLDLTRFSYWIDTLVLKLREILTAPVLHHPFLFKGKTNASPVSVNVPISGAVVWEVLEGFLAPLPGRIKSRTHTSKCRKLISCIYFVCQLPLELVLAFSLKRKGWCSTWAESISLSLRTKVSI